MDPVIRPLTIDCEGASMAAVLHDAGGTAGFLVVSGGLQTRAGAHRLFTELGAAMAMRGYPALRFDRRGVGDSGGDDRGFEGSGADMAAAAAALRDAVPGCTRLVGFGLCDGASALALFGADAGLTDLILLNPWAIEPGAPAAIPAAAQRDRLLRRLVNPAAWRRLFGGGVDVAGSLKSLFRARRESGALADSLVAAINGFRGHVLVILSAGDATAQHFGALLPRLGPNVEVAHLPGADHTLTRRQDFAAMLMAVDKFLR